MLLDELQKSETGRKMLAEIKKSELAESEWQSAVAELKELRKTRQEWAMEFQATVDQGNQAVKVARQNLNDALRKSNDAYRNQLSQMAMIDRRISELSDILYRTAPAELIQRRNDLAEKLLHNLSVGKFDTPSDVDLSRRKVHVDRTQINQHLEEREEIKKELEEIEAKIRGEG